MALARLKNLAKLTLLLGAPVAVLALLFSCGVYCGHENRVAVLKFERDWLGFDVTVPGEPVKPEPVKTEPVKTEPVKTEPVKTEPVKTEPVVPPEPVVAVNADALPFVMPEPAPLSGENRAKLDSLVRLKVLVLVDPVLAARQPDWLMYVQRHVTWGSQVLEKQIGVHLDLHGVVRMEEIPQGLADVQEHAREGADLLLVFVDREFRGPIEVPEIIGANVDVMLVQAVGHSPSGHLRGLLFALGQVLGAQPLGESDESWMGGVRVDDARPIKLDATNRMLMLTRKSLGFASPPKPTKDEVPADPRLPSVQDPEPEQPEEESN